MPFRQKFAKIFRLRLALAHIPNRQKLMIALAAVICVGLIGADYIKLVTQKIKITPAGLSRQPSKAYLSSAARLSRPKEHLDNTSESISPVINRVVSNRVELLSPNMHVQTITERAVRQKIAAENDQPSKPVIEEPYRPKPITSIPSLLVETSADSMEQFSDLKKELDRVPRFTNPMPAVPVVLPADSVEQISDLEKELNRRPRFTNPAPAIPVKLPAELAEQISDLEKELNRRPRFINPTPVVPATLPANLLKKELSRLPRFTMSTSTVPAILIADSLKKN